MVSRRIDGEKKALLLKRSGHRFNQLKKAYDLLETCDGKRHLDIGCGKGLLEEYFPDRMFVGMDIDFESVHTAMQNAPQSLYTLGDILNLPFKSDSAQVITLMAVLGSVPPGKEESVFQDVKRVLQTGGSLVILVSQDSQPYSLLVPDRLFGGWQWRHFKAEFLLSILEEAGFSIKKVQYGGGGINLAIDLFHFVWDRIWRLCRGRFLPRWTVPKLPYKALAKIERFEFGPFGKGLKKLARYVYIVAEKR